MGNAEQHLTLELIEHPYGRCQAILTDLDGNVLVDRIYKNKNSAQASIRTRLKKEGLLDASLTRVTPEDQDEVIEAPEPEPLEAPTTVPASPTDRWLVKLRQEAHKALEQALKLREQAEALELDHKRLTAAADVLEGPEG
jgi:hypothetical protein